MQLTHRGSVTAGHTAGERWGAQGWGSTQRRGSACAQPERTQLPGPNPLLCQTSSGLLGGATAFGLESGSRPPSGHSYEWVPSLGSASAFSPGTGGPSPCLATRVRGFWGCPASLPACLPFQAGHQAELLHVAGKFLELLEAKASTGPGPPARCWRACTSASPGGGLLQTFCSVLSLQHPPAINLTRVWAFLWGFLANLSHKMHLTAALHRALGQLGLTWGAPC